MPEEQINNPLHGITLEALVTELVENYGWDVLAEAFRMNCFKSNQSVKSTLKFLRKTPWAREKVEGFYLYKYKRLPKPPYVKEESSSRDRDEPRHQKPRAAINEGSAQRSDSPSSDAKPSRAKQDDPWANWKKK